MIHLCLYFSFCLYVFFLFFIFFYFIKNAFCANLVKHQQKHEIDQNYGTEKQHQQQQQLKELKLVHRNQTILTSSSSDYDQDIPFDFDTPPQLPVGIDIRNSKLNEPMEYEQNNNNNNNNNNHNKDIEMKSIDSNNGAVTTAVRPTTLNIPGPECIFSLY